MVSSLMCTSTHLNAVYAHSTVEQLFLTTEYMYTFTDSCSLWKGFNTPYIYTYHPKSS